tara:strand:+ start:111 stop:650 length:540 start_codon:yes stop_codon:yes gene_type:complete
MAITIDGSGTVTGISAGGLPDGCITTADLASGVGGKIIQQVSANFDAASDSGDGANSTSYSDSGITATITPSSGSKILIMSEGCSFGYKPSSNEVSYFINLVGTPSGGSATQHREIQMRMTSNGGGTQRLYDSWNINFTHTHGLNGSTAITYKIQHKTHVTDYAWARYKGASIVLLEIN